MTPRYELFRRQRNTQELARQAADARHRALLWATCAYPDMTRADYYIRLATEFEQLSREASSGQF